MKSADGPVSVYYLPRSICSAVDFLLVIDGIQLPLLRGSLGVKAAYR